MRLAVPFGKANLYCISSRTHQNQPTLYDAKEIHQILDETLSFLRSRLLIGNGSHPLYAIGDVYIAAQCQRFTRVERLFLKNRCFLLMKAHFLMMSF
jgi:primosomal protein N' (replication factor Y)